MSSDEHFMWEAIQAARPNINAPFGTVIVDTVRSTIISTGCNHTIDGPIWHGEIDAICKASEKIGGGDWRRMRLYTTAEPCCMCQGAILWAGIGSVVYGTSMQTLLDLGWPQINLTSHGVASSSSWTSCSTTGGVLANECDKLFRAARQS